MKQDKIIINFELTEHRKSYTTINNSPRSYLFEKHLNNPCFKLCITTYHIYKALQSKNLIKLLDQAVNQDCKQLCIALT